jgi:nucleoside-diphosphate-sugar epimerase
MKVLNKILITGANGFIGRNLSKLLSEKYKIDTVSRNELDLTDYESTKKFFSDKQYDLVIHTAIEGGRRTKPDTEEMFYKNILMTYNLLSNKHCFDKIITFGSGAELDRRFDINIDSKDRYPIDYYGMSKSVISKLCLIEDKMYNFRIFNCFGTDENSDRLIRGNIEKKINGLPMTLFSNRLMDFFYIDDLAKMIDEFLIDYTRFPKTIDCVYEKSFRLKEILEMINDVDDDRVEIVSMEDESINKINSTNGDYVGNYFDLGIKFIGLQESIKIIYNRIKETI